MRMMHMHKNNKQLSMICRTSQIPRNDRKRKKNVVSFFVKYISSTGTLGSGELKLMKFLCPVDLQRICFNNILRLFSCKLFYLG